MFHLFHRIRDIQQTETEGIFIWLAFIATSE